MNQSLMENPNGIIWHMYRNVGVLPPLRAHPSRDLAKRGTTQHANFASLRL
jgi:hypothetical protein